jgi:hypothetical protein
MWKELSEERQTTHHAGPNEFENTIQRVRFDFLHHLAGTQGRW